MATEKEVVIYSSSVGGTFVQKNTESLTNLVKATLGSDPEVVFIDVDASKKQMVFDKAGRGNLPVLFINDEFIGNKEDCVELNEIGELAEKLGQN
jgi:glutaredoxin